MRWMHTLLLVWTISLSSAALAEDVAAMSTPQIIEAVEQTYKSVDSVKASFTQTTSSVVAGENVQKGTLELKRPRRARWEFNQPQQNIIVADGKKIWIYDPAANQVIVTPDLSGDAANPTGDLMGLLTDLSKVDEHFSVQSVPGAEASHTLELTPNNEQLKVQIKTLQLVLSKQKYVLEKMILEDPFGQVTTLEFSQVELGAAIDDARFQFVVPDGATVVDGGGL